MQFPGYWVFGAGSKVWVTPEVFDDTEVSPESGWTEAHQNGESDGDGFICTVPEALLNNVCDRILRKEPRFVEANPHPGYKGEIIHLATLESLAEFISGLELRVKGPGARSMPVSDDVPGKGEIPL
jgi:hypothetical protein